MKLQQLRYFVAVAEELHFGRAAQRENVSQPPLSYQIKKLEQELDLELFHRTKRRVTLSEAGKALLPNARNILKDLNIAAETAKQAHRGEFGKLTIGFVHSAAFEYLPTLIGPFRRAYPEVELTLKEMTVSEQNSALTQKTIDIGIIRPPVMVKGITGFKVVSEPFVLAVPIGHPLSRQESVNLVDLSDEDFVFSPRHPSPAFHQQRLTMCSEAGFMPRIVVVSNTNHTAIGLVGTGAGIAIVPNCVRCIRLPSVKFVDLMGTNHKAELTMVYSKHDLSATGKKLIEYASSQILKTM